MKNKYIFSLREELSILITYASPNYDFYKDSSSLALKLGSNFLAYILSAYNLSDTQREGINLFLEDYDIIKWDSNSSKYVLGDYVKEVLDLFSSRYADEMILKTYEIDNSNLKFEARKIFDKLLNVLCFTYDKYKNLLDYYKDTKGVLLKAIEDTYVDFENYLEENESSQENNREANSSSNNSREGTSYNNNSRQTNSSQANSRNANTEGTSRVNDTPQNRDSGGYGNEDYATQIEFANSNDSESTSSNAEGEENSQQVGAETESSSNTTSNSEEVNVKNTGSSTHNRNLYHVASHDRDTLMERLKQIDEYYRNIYKSWLKEFESLTWEVANYEE